ncbi:MAG: ANTAR domain-containing protein [Oscillospiraceae bacterium]|nr:ANTAR domain-containing protein [Oscillospiraceae bacterium]
MKIFINAKTEDICKNIGAALEELSADITHCFDDETAACTELSEYDAVIVSTPLRSEFGLNFVTETSKSSGAAIVILSRADIAEDVQGRIKFTGAFVIGKPFPKSVLANTVKMAILAKENIMRLEQEKDELSKQLDDVKIIDRAKCCLIEYLNLTENQAHRHIQKLAMDTRRSQREIADDILRTYSGMTNV